MSNNNLLKLTLLAGIDMTALSGTIAGAADESGASAAAVSTATPTKPVSAGKPDLTEKEVWGHDYSHAWHRAKKVNRPVLLHFHAAWCHACQQMEREVLNTSTVLSALDACCVAVKIDCDQQPDLVQKFRIEALPCDVLVTPDLRMHRINDGFASADRYSALVSKAVKQRTEARIQVSAN
jgi:thioredoxin-like negative regulator of GroEL